MRPGAALRPDDVRPPDVRPWYREPWPWVLIAIPAASVIASFFTLWLALAHPDALVVTDTEYHDVRAGLRAEPAAGTEPTPSHALDGPDGDR